MRCINLSTNCITDYGISHIIERLQEATQLIEVVLSSNPRITNSGLRKILQFMTQQPLVIFTISKMDHVDASLIEEIATLSDDYLEQYKIRNSL
mgnify:CR=1 FL=1